MRRNRTPLSAPGIRHDDQRSQLRSGRLDDDEIVAWGGNVIAGHDGEVPELLRGAQAGLRLGPDTGEAQDGLKSLSKGRQHGSDLINADNRKEYACGSLTLKEAVGAGGANSSAASRR